jgi:hypothetical protein
MFTLTKLAYELHYAKERGMVIKAPLAVALDTTVIGWREKQTKNMAIHWYLAAQVFSGLFAWIDIRPRD